MITSGSTPKALGGGKMTDDCFGCEDHATTHKPKKHPEFGSKGDKMVGDHQRGAGHPKNHTAGQMPSQLQPDHGPHR